VAISTLELSVGFGSNLDYRLSSVERDVDCICTTLVFGYDVNVYC